MQLFSVAAISYLNFVLKIMYVYQRIIKPLTRKIEIENFIDFILLTKEIFL